MPRQHPHSQLHALLHLIRLLQQLCAAIPGRERAPAAVLLPAPARSCPGLTPGQLEQAGRGAWTCLMHSRAACLRCHELPWAPSGEAGDGVGKSWHSPPCSYSQQAGATPALESTPPGCTRPSLEEDTRSRAEVGATGCCGTVQHPNTTNVPAWLGLQALCPATWAVLQKPGCIHNTCPLVCHRGAQAAAPAENRDPPTPCLPPSHHGAILEHRNCHFGAG